MKNAKRLLYVLKTDDGARVKIGITDDLTQRIDDLEYGSGHKLEIVATYTMQDFEHHLQNACAQHRTVGEWFTADALVALSSLLPPFRYKGNHVKLTACRFCGQSFRAKRGRTTCGSELCKRRQAIDAGQQLKGTQRKARPKCAVCGKELRLGKKVCNTDACLSSWNEAQRKPLQDHQVQTKRPCSVEGCNKAATASRGWCPMHYQRWRQHGSLEARRYVPQESGHCSVAQCEKPSVARGLCRLHYSRWYKNGHPSGSERRNNQEQQSVSA